MFNVQFKFLKIYVYVYIHIYIISDKEKVVPGT